MDFTAPAIQTQPAPPNAGTKHPRPIANSSRDRTARPEGHGPARLPLRPAGTPMAMTEISPLSGPMLEGEPIGSNRAPGIGRNGLRDRMKCDKTVGSSTGDASQPGAPRLAATRQHTGDEGEMRRFEHPSNTLAALFLVFLHEGRGGRDQGVDGHGILERVEGVVHRVDP